MISVSVAMATCNGQRHIRRQLDSLAAQSHLPAELIITDDMSDDDTVATIDAFAKATSFPVNVYRNETRLGYRANFMRAASLCRSELIAFCDQDDFWNADKIAVMAQLFGDPEVLLSYHNADLVTVEGMSIGTLAAHAARRPVLLPMSSGPWWPYALGFTQVFRRSLMRLSYLWPNSCDHNDVSQRLAHDQWFFFLAAVFGRIAYFDAPLVAYMQHGTNTVGYRKTRFRELVRQQFRDRSDDYSHYAKDAESRAAILEIAKDNLESIWAERAAAAAEYYRKVSWLFAKRNTLYTSGTLMDRLNAFHAILWNSGYGRAWGLGRRSLAADICLGVPIGHLMRGMH